MRNTYKHIRNTVFASLLACSATPAWSHGITADDQKLIDAASCDEIVKQYNIHVAEEKAIADEIARSKRSNTAFNVAGVATLAAFGVGFFSWDDHSSAEENLAEVRHYREAIAAAGRKKSCNMP